MIRSVQQYIDDVGFCQATGVRQFGERSNMRPSSEFYAVILKYMSWSVLVILLLVLTVWQVGMLYKDFQDPPHYISSSFVTFDKLQYFPNVTVCNFNRVNKTLADELNIDDLMVEHLLLAQVATYELHSDPMSERFKAQEQAWLRYKNRADIPLELKDAGKLLRHLAHSCEKTMQICLFGSVKFNCCDTAVSVMNGEYGACWVINAPIFNDNENRAEQATRGVSGGLRIIIDPSIGDYLQGVIENNYLENGIVVAPNFNPLEAFFPEVVAVSPGYHARISLKKRKRRNKKARFEVFERDCIENGVLNYTLGIFDFSTCEDDCNQKEVIAHCGCTQIQEIPEKYQHIPSCDGSQVVNCVDNMTTNTWLDTGLLSDMRLCMDKCIPTCSEMRDISTVTSTTRWPAKQYHDDLRAYLSVPETYSVNITENNIATKIEDLILVDVFFPSMYYTMVEETEKTTLFELVGSIGGHLGLWLGVSVVTVVQLAIGCLTWVWRFDSKRRADVKVVMKEETHSDKVTNVVHASAFPEAAESRAVHPIVCDSRITMRSQLRTPSL